MKIRFHVGLPLPRSPAASGVADWSVVRGTERIEPTAESLLGVCALSLALAGVVALVWYLVEGLWRLFPASAATMLVLVIALLPLHEAIHFFALPRTVTERGLGVFAGGAFVSIYGAMSRSRALVVFLAPFGLITFGPLLWRIAGGPIDERVVFLSILNAGASILDVVKSFHIVRQVPMKSAVHFGTTAIRYESGAGPRTT